MRKWQTSQDAAREAQAVRCVAILITLMLLMCGYRCWGEVVATKYERFNHGEWHIVAASTQADALIQRRSRRAVGNNEYIYNADGSVEACVYYSGYTNGYRVVLMQEAWYRNGSGRKVKALHSLKGRLFWRIEKENDEGKGISAIVPNNIAEWCRVDIYNESGKSAGEWRGYSTLNKALKNEDIVLKYRQYRVLYSEGLSGGDILFEPEQHVVLKEGGKYRLGITIKARIWMEGRGKDVTVLFPPVEIDVSKDDGVYGDTSVGKVSIYNIAFCIIMVLIAAVGIRVYRQRGRTIY